MKNKKFMLGIIVGIILTSTAGYAVYKYQATDVGYTPDNSEFKVDNVSDAINELYDKTNNCKEYYSKATYVAPKEGETHKGIIYIDPTDLQKKCTEKEAVSNVNENGTPTEIKKGCMKWYVFDDGGDNYTMILDHSTTARQAWMNNADVNYENSLVKPVVDKLVSESGWKVTPRLITAEEINTITKNTTFDLTTTGNYCFESKKKDSNSSPFCNQTTNNKYSWLFNYLNGCKVVGCDYEDSSTNAYWTQTKVGNLGYVWYIVRWGMLDYGRQQETPGVRPVITIPKNIIK